MAEHENTSHSSDIVNQQSVNALVNSVNSVHSLAPHDSF